MNIPTPLERLPHQHYLLVFGALAAFLVGIGLFQDWQAVRARIAAENARNQPVRITEQQRAELFRPIKAGTSTPLSKLPAGEGPSEPVQGGITMTAAQEQEAFRPVKAGN